MTTQSRSALFWMAAGAFPILITIGTTQLAYATGHYPHASPLVHLGIAIAVIVGAALLCGVEFAALGRRVAGTAAFILVAVIVCYIVGFMTGCSNGDCI